MNESETLRLLEQMNREIQYLNTAVTRMETRHRRFRCCMTAVLCLVLAGVCALVFWAAPRVRTVVAEYNAAVSQVQQLGEELTQLDLGAVGRALSSLEDVDLSVLEDIDLSALEQAAQNLQQVDFSTLEESFDFLQQVDLQKLSDQVEQVQSVLQSLEGLDAQALNTAVNNLNRALETILGLFD